MKTKLVILISLALVLCSPAFAQKNKLATISPETVVKNLYAAHNARRSPFFQKKSRALVDKYFTGSLADAIWQDALNTKSDEVGTLNFDPLYNAQDIQITNFVIAKSTPDNVVKVRFINIGEPDEITFTLRPPIRPRRFIRSSRSYIATLRIWNRSCATASTAVARKLGRSMVITSSAA
ncbi:MAG: hypothetical protein IPP63_05110 [Chloracidobacterium sp.]|nr:hypothetical protein [Chloracidobacterium sp.]